MGNTDEREKLAACMCFNSDADSPEDHKGVCRFFDVVDAQACHRVVIHITSSLTDTRDSIEDANERVNGEAEEEGRDGTSHVHPN